jgi:SAM-dependent methyltransferase
MSNTKYWFDRWDEAKAKGLPYTWFTSWDNYRSVQCDNVAFVKELVRRLGANSVLDFGCGYAEYNEVCEDYTGVDIIPELINENKEKYHTKNFDILPCAFKDYDLIFSIAVMHYLDYHDFNRYVSLFARHCKWFYMQEVSEKNDGHTIHRDTGEIIDTVEYYGFRTIECKDRRFLFENNKHSIAL